MSNLFLKLSNMIMKPLLRSPLHFFANNYTLISFTGRKSGNVYTTPVEYKRSGHTLIVFTQRNRAWWRNFQGSAPVRLRLNGQDVSGVADVPIVDIGELFDTLKWMHPHLHAEQLVKAMENIVLIQIHLPQTEAVHVR
ncbi:MAG: nitroreductase/quinone reductase family protein [Chloroflexota bacterium]